MEAMLRCWPRKGSTIPSMKPVLPIGPPPLSPNPAKSSSKAFRSFPASSSSGFRHAHLAGLRGLLALLNRYCQQLWPPICGGGDVSPSPLAATLLLSPGPMLGEPLSCPAEHNGSGDMTHSRGSAGRLEKGLEPIEGQVNCNLVESVLRLENNGDFCLQIGTFKTFWGENILQGPDGRSTNIPPHLPFSPWLNPHSKKVRLGRRAVVIFSPCWMMETATHFI